MLAKLVDNFPVETQRPPPGIYFIMSLNFEIFQMVIHQRGLIRVKKQQWGGSERHLILSERAKTRSLKAEGFRKFL